MSELPAGWHEVQLNDVAQWGSGGTPSRSNPDYYNGTIPWIKTGELGAGVITKTDETITESGLLNSSAKVYSKGAVAVAMYGATIGKTSILGIDAATNQACAVGVPTAGITSTEYLYFYLQSQKEGFIEAGKGGAQPNISQNIIKNWPMPLAPQNEQKRIADKLDALLKRVDACREKLDRVPLILKRFREAVLAAACSGRLTAIWREEQGVVENWASTTLGNLLSFITSGSRGWADYYSESGSAFIRAQNIKSDFLDLSDIAFVQLPHGVEGVRTKIAKDDLLITITGANVTKCARVIDELDDAYVSQHVALARLKDIHHSPYIFFYLISPAHGRAQLLEAAYGLGKPGLNLDNIRDVEIHLPRPSEQAEIVRRIAKLFAFADGMEARYHAARKQVDQLTPSLLAKAFRGELVEQDPNDEPASVLLERIKAERVKTVTTRSPAPARSTRSTRQSKQATPPPTPEPAKEFGTNIPHRLLAAMQAGREYGRGEITAASGISDIEWSWAIKQLKEEGKVRQTGERRGARYCRL